MPPTRNTKAKSPLVKRLITIDEIATLERLADIYWKARCYPGGCGNPGQVLAVMIAGWEIGIGPTQSMQHGQFAVSKKTDIGKISFYADAVIAIMRASGKLEYIKESFIGTGDTLTAVCVIKRSTDTTEIRKEYSLGDAKLAGLLDKKDSPWITNPKSMLEWRARHRAIRLGFADFLNGVGIIGEDEEETVTTPVTKPTATGTTTTVKTDGPNSPPPPAAGTTEPKPTTTPGGGGESKAVPEVATTETAKAPDAVPAAAATVTTPAEDAPSFDPAELTTDADIATIAELKNRWWLLACNGANRPAEEGKAAWAEILKPFGITSVKGAPRNTTYRIMAALKEELKAKSIF